jgi:hypothetical protein
LSGRRGAQELDHQALALLADVDPHLRAGQADDDAAGAIGAAAEVDVTQGLLVDVLRGGKVHRLLRLAAMPGAGVRSPAPPAAGLALQLGAVAAACFRFSTRRVRSPAWPWLTLRRLPWLISTTVAQRIVTPGRSIAMRGGVCTEKPLGTAPAARSSRCAPPRHRPAGVLVIDWIVVLGPAPQAALHIKGPAATASGNPAARHLAHMVVDLLTVVWGRWILIAPSLAAAGWRCVRSIRPRRPARSRAWHLGFVDLGDAAVVLAQVVTHLHLVQQVVDAQQGNRAPRPC